MKELSISVPIPDAQKPTQEQLKMIQDHVEQSKPNPSRLSIMLPAQFEEAAVDLNVRRRAYNALLNELAKLEITMNCDMQGLFLGIRKYLAENGYPDIWVKDMGFDSDALEIGVHVVNINEKRG